MKLPSHRTLVAALAVSGVLFVSACGASGGSDASSTTAKPADKTTTTKATTTTTEADADAQARADSVDITLSEFPDGWTAAPASTDDSDSPMKKCDPTFSDDSAKLAKHRTDEFSVGAAESLDLTQFSAETVVFEDADAADAAVEVFNDPEVISCLDSSLKDTLGSDGTTIEGSLSEDDLDPGTDNSAGVSGTFTLTSTDGTTAKITVAILAMSTNDVGTMVTILTMDQGFDPTTLQDPITTLAKLQGEA